MNALLSSATPPDRFSQGRRCFYRQKTPKVNTHAALAKPVAPNSCSFVQCHPAGRRGPPRSSSVAFLSPRLSPFPPSPIFVQPCKPRPPFRITRIGEVSFYPALPAAPCPQNGSTSSVEYCSPIKERRRHTFGGQKIRLHKEAAACEHRGRCSASISDRTTSSIVSPVQPRSSPSTAKCAPRATRCSSASQKSLPGGPPKSTRKPSRLQGGRTLRSRRIRRDRRQSGPSGHPLFFSRQYHRTSGPHGHASLLFCGRSNRWVTHPWREGPVVRRLGDLSSAKESADSPANSADDTADRGADASSWHRASPPTGAVPDAPYPRPNPGPSSAPGPGAGKRACPSPPPAADLQ